MDLLWYAETIRRYFDAKRSSWNVKPSNVSRLKKKKDASSTKEVEWLENQNMLMSKLIDSYKQSESGTSESMEDNLFGQIVAKSITKILQAEIIKELKLKFNNGFFPLKGN